MKEQLIKDLIAEGYKRTTLVLLNETQLKNLHKKLGLSEEDDKKVDVEVNQKKADEVIDRVDPDKVATVKIDTTEETDEDKVQNKEKPKKKHKLHTKEQYDTDSQETSDDVYFPPANDWRKKRKKTKSNIGKFHKPVFKNEKKLKEKSDEIGLSEKNYLSFAKKGEIMEMLMRKLNEQSAPAIAPTKPKTKPTTKPTSPTKPNPAKNPFAPNPKQNPNPQAKLPEFLTYDAIMNSIENDVAEPVTKPKTKPTTKPKTPAKPNPAKNPFAPNPKQNPNPQAKK